MLLYEFDYVFEVGYSGCFGAVVGGGDEVVDCDLVIVEEGVDVRLVEDAGALGLWEDEVEEEAEADPGVEWDPADVRSCSIELKREAYQTRMKPAQDSKSNAQASTTQYISHGFNSAGSVVLRAL
jgi:hypothetical protein